MVRKTDDYKTDVIKAMKSACLYNPSLDLQILSLAGALRSLALANADIDKLDSTVVTVITRYGSESLAPHPAFKIQKDAQDSVTRQMKALGLTTEMLIGTDENDPLYDLTTTLVKATSRKPQTVQPRKTK